MISSKLCFPIPITFVTSITFFLIYIYLFFLLLVYKKWESQATLSLCLITHPKPSMPSLLQQYIRFQQHRSFQRPVQARLRKESLQLAVPRIQAYFPELVLTWKSHGDNMKTPRSFLRIQSNCHCSRHDIPMSWDTPYFCKWSHQYSTDKHSPSCCL